MRLGDEAEKVVVNADGRRDGLDGEMAALLNFVRDNRAESELTRELRDAVLEAIEHKEWRDEYMTFRMKLNEEREEGREEGRKEGRKEGETKLGELIAKLLELGRSDDAAVAATDGAERKRLYEEFGIV